MVVIKFKFGVKCTSIVFAPQKQTHYKLLSLERDNLAALGAVMHTKTNYTPMPASRILDP